MSEEDSDFIIFPLFEEEVRSKMSIIGNIGEFDSNVESWDSYIERFELFLSCNGIDDNSKKVSTFLTVVGVKTYSLLRDLCTPEKPTAKTYEGLVKLIQEHLYPKPNLIAERYKFSLRNQLEHESISDYVANLKKLSTHCEFGTNLNDYLRDRVVSGIRNESTKQKLLAESDLTFDKALKLITSLEAAEKNAASLMGADYHQHGGRVQRLTAQHRHGTTTRQDGSTSTRGVPGQGQMMRNQHQLNASGTANVKCYCCGQSGHMSKSCRFHGCVCHHCGKRNHLAKVCRSRLSQTGKPKNSKNFTKPKNNHSKKHNYVGTSAPDPTHDEVYDVSNLFKISPEPINNVNKLKIEPVKIHVNVENQMLVFEVDTGASVSVISEKFYKDNFKSHELKPSDLSLRSYTDIPIEPVGKIKVNVSYQGTNVDDLELYVIKNGSHPLMGRDWLSALNVEISFKSNTLYVTEGNDESHQSTHFEEQVKQLINEFPEVFTDKLGEYKSDPVKIHVKEHCIPKYCKPRPLPFTLKAKVEKELSRLVDEDILYPVQSSEWATPIVPILKKDGSLRICGDYKITLNPYLEIDRHPLPRIEDLFNDIQKGDFYSKIDLSQAYMQLRLDEEAQKLCTISTHKGLFSYKRMPYGIASAPGIFQRKIEQVLQGLPSVAVFLDDILVSNCHNVSHLNTLKEVLKRLKEVGLTVKSEKCTFFQSSLEYLGFVIDKNGLHTAPSKVKAVIDAPIPQNVTEVKSFIGLIIYYGRFVPNLSSVLYPLYNLLKKDVAFVFDDKCMKAFNHVKQLLSSAPVLAHYDTQAPTVLTVDASNTGIGCVLSIIDKNNVERPVSYSSRTLTAAEKNYSQIDKEALAVVYGVRKYHQYLFGKHFTLKCDHKPLVSIFGPKKGLPVFAASRLQRYALFLSGYSYDIQYVRSNVNSADALSRLPLDVKHPSEDNLLWVGTYLQFIEESSFPVTCEDVKIETQKDPILNKVLGYVMYGWPNTLPDDYRHLLPYFQRKVELAVEQGVLMWGFKVVIPAKLRAHVLKELHSSHVGIVKMKSVARSYMWWPNIDHDIESLANSCSSCLLERSNPVKVELHNWHYPSRPWERLHLDYLGPFNGKTYLIVVDAYTKWLEVFETNSTSAKVAIHNLRSLFARFGLPITVHSDNGPPFNSVEFGNFLKANGIKHTTSAPYHPQSNGQAENSVRYAKNKLKCAFRENVDVSLALSRILFDYRNSVHLTTNETPAKLMFNRNLRTRLDLLRPDVNTYVEERQNKQKMYAGGSKTKCFFTNQLVLVRSYRAKDKWIEGTILQQISPTMYAVTLNSGIVWKRHVDQLIPIDTPPFQTTTVADSQAVAVTAPIGESRGVPRSPIQPQLMEDDVTRPHAGGTSPLHTRHTPPSRHSLPRIPSPAVLSPSPARQTAAEPMVRRYPERNRKPTERLDL